MWSKIGPAIRINLFLTLALGVVYPLAVTGICQLAFSHQANGSLITVRGRVIGSKLIGQNFSRPEYFHPRPSAAGADGYDAASSGGSNLGPTSRKLADRVRAAVAKFRSENPDYSGPIPADLLTTSASGLDPDISPASALAQAPRIALARGVPLEKVDRLIASLTEKPRLGLLGEPRVNVLAINLALDHEMPER
jgi:K+-transporting ATPase ATPase C chain